MGKKKKELCAVLWCVGVSVCVSCKQVSIVEEKDEKKERKTCCMQIGIGILFVAAAIVEAAASAFVSLLLQLAATETQIPCLVHALHVQVVVDYAAIWWKITARARARAIH